MTEMVVGLFRFHYENNVHKSSWGLTIHSVPPAGNEIDVILLQYLKQHYTPFYHFNNFPFRSLLCGVVDGEVDVKPIRDRIHGSVPRECARAGRVHWRCTDRICKAA